MRRIQDLCWYADYSSEHDVPVVISADEWLSSTDGSNTSTADCSWWPKHATWIKSGMNIGYWSEQNEQWFVHRRDNIRKGGDALKLRNAKQWRTALRYELPRSKAVREYVEEITSNSL